MTQVKIFSNLRFPLIVLVIFIHVYAGLSQVVDFSGYIVEPIMTWISQVLARAAVPMFFIISGFFFFYGVDKFDKDCYIGKLKRRVKSLLVPYVIWNTVFVSLYVFLKGHEFSIRDYWDANGGEPICYPFWFIRDLMIVCLFTPIIYWLIKQVKVIAIVCLFCWFIMGGGISESIVFFTVGATLSILKIDIKLPFNIAAPIATFTLIGSMALTSISLTNNTVLYAVVLALVVGIYSIMCCLPARCAVPGFVSDSTLFVLAFSTLLIMVLVTLTKGFVGQSNVTLLASYVAIGALSALISVAGYCLLSHFKWSFVLTGKTKK